jgi:ectoine hydroxylase-related dioxygenase (phytanoyl-CoA dioxygenase family)
VRIIEPVRLPLQSACDAVLGSCRRDQPVAAQASRVQTWTVRAGDCLLIHPQTWHASLPQRSPERRRLACTSRWLGSDLAFQPRPYSFNGYYRAADLLSVGARPPFDFLPTLVRSSS